MAQVTFHLDAFDGPLDLLLHLLSKNKIDIIDIPVAAILEQYLAYLDTMRDMDIEVTGEFITMAAHLVYIKSKMLLPVYEEEGQEDPREALVQSLIEYQQFKEAGGVLSNRFEIGKDLFIRNQEPLVRDKHQLYSHTADQLEAAIRDILERSNMRLPPPATAFSGIVGRETVTVGEKVNYILRLFRKNALLDFTAIVLECQSRTEIVALFLAVLELSKTKKLVIEDSAGGYTLSLTGEDNEL